MSARDAAWFLERRYPDTWGPKATAWQREQEWQQRSEWVSVDDLDKKLMSMVKATSEPAHH